MGLSGSRLSGETYESPLEAPSDALAARFRGDGDVSENCDLIGREREVRAVVSTRPHTASDGSQVASEAGGNEPPRQGGARHESHRGQYRQPDPVATQNPAVMAFVR